MKKFFTATVAAAFAAAALTACSNGPSTEETCQAVGEALNPINDIFSGTVSETAEVQEIFSTAQADLADVAADTQDDELRGHLENLAEAAGLYAQLADEQLPEEEQTELSSQLEQSGVFQSLDEVDIICTEYL